MINYIINYIKYYITLAYHFTKFINLAHFNNIFTSKSSLNIRYIIYDKILPYYLIFTDIFNSCT